MNINLTVFLSFRGSLSKWQSDAILNREMKPYLAMLLAGHCRKVQIFSYDQSDKAILQKLRNANPAYHQVTIITPQTQRRGRFLQDFIWSVLGPISRRRQIAQSQILKTNQISGSWTAVIARLLTGRPLILRMGYLLSRRFALNKDLTKGRLAQGLETLCFRSASRLVFTADHVGEYLSTKGWAEKSRRLPAYVDTAHFVPVHSYDFQTPIVTISRLTPQKNLANLIRACKMLNRKLVIYGSGPQERKLKALSREIDADVEFAGSIDNDAIPEKLRAHSIFVLPSYHEGLPKSLMEAMACGLICAASNIPGVTDLIEDGKNGYLINGHQQTNIATTLLRIQQDRNDRIGQAAHQSIANGYSLNHYIVREVKLYAELL